MMSQSRYAIIFFVLTLILGANAFATSNNSSPDDKAIMVNASQPDFTIQLRANPTTGYQWYIKKYDRNLMQLVSSSFQAFTGKLVGAPGTQIYKFIMLPESFKAHHLTCITLAYARAWNLSQASIKKIQVAT